MLWGIEDLRRNDPAESEAFLDIVDFIDHETTEAQEQNPHVKSITLFPASGNWPPSLLRHLASRENLEACKLNNHDHPPDQAVVRSFLEPLQQNVAVRSVL